MKSRIIALLVALGFVALIMLSIVPQAFTAEQETEEKVQSICPKTLMKDSCMSCHVIPDWGLKEPDPDRYNLYPTDMKVRGDIGYLLLESIYSDFVKEFFDYLNKLHIKHAVIEVHSPGGRLFECSRIIGLMHEFERNGGIVETRLYGMAFSAGFAVFVSGTIGHRHVSPVAECMWHELITGEFFAIKTPADKEDEARVLRHLQDTTNNWIVSRSKMTKKTLDEKIRKKEFWINGAEAVDLGFADKLIGE